MCMPLHPVALWALVSSLFTPGLLGQNQHALLRVCISTAENILLLPYVQFESGHELWMGGLLHLSLGKILSNDSLPEISETDSLEFYWQVIKSGSYNLFWGRILGPLNHSVFCLSKKNPFYFSFVKPKVEEKKICTLCHFLVPTGLNSCGYLALGYMWKFRALGGVVGEIEY